MFKLICRFVLLLFRSHAHFVTESGTNPSQCAEESRNGILFSRLPSSIAIHNYRVESSPTNIRINTHQYRLRIAQVVVIVSPKSPIQAAADIADAVIIAPDRLSDHG